MKGAHVLVGTTAIAVAMSIAFGCTGDDPDIETAPPDAASDVPTTGDAMTGPRDCSALFVRLDAPADNDGCSSDKPLPSIGAALAKARTATLRPKEVRVCQGTYLETNLTLDIPVSLHGGFDCTTWKPDPARVYPTLTGATESIVRNGNFALRGQTLLVKGAAIGSEIVIDGFTFQGGPANPTDPTDGTSIAVAVSDEARPKIEANRIVGGATTGTNVGSIGLQTIGKAAPDIVHNVIDGGRGVVTNNRYGSIGISVAGSAAPHIHENIIEGGAGSGAGAYIASVGLLAHMGTATDTTLTKKNGAAIESNHINGGTGKTTGGNIGSCGVYDEYGAVELIGNVIRGGQGVSPSTDGLPSAVSVFVFAAPLGDEPVVIERNRIFGGRRSGFSTDDMPYLTVFRTFDTHRLHVVNNLIVGASGASQKARVLEVSRNGGLENAISFRNNTILGPELAAAATGSLAFFDLHTGIDLQNNVLVPRGNETVFVNYGCPLYGTSVIEANTILAPASLIAAEGLNCAAATTIDAMQAELSGPTQSATKNVRYAESCGGDTGCIAKAECKTGPECAASFIATWKGDQVDELGWPLKADVSCSIVQGGNDLLGGGTWPPDGGAVPLRAVTTDFLGAARTGPFSRGAHEQDSAGCTNP